jgi:hypothetical protein
LPTAPGNFWLVGHAFVLMCGPLLVLCRTADCALLYGHGRAGLSIGVQHERRQRLQIAGRFAFWCVVYRAHATRVRLVRLPFSCSNLLSRSVAATNTHFFLCFVIGLRSGRASTAAFAAFSFNERSASSVAWRRRNSSSGRSRGSSTGWSRRGTGT